MGMICKMNRMGVPIQVKDILFNTDRKEQRKNGCFECARRITSRRTTQTSSHPRTRKRGAKAKLTSSKTRDDSSSEDEVQHRRHDRHSSSSRSSHNCLMTRGNIKDSSFSENDSGSKNKKPSTEELAQVVMFLRKFALNKKSQFKTSN